jgi:hypothetical protein
LIDEVAAEKLETEAILNAPPAADNIEILEKKDDVGVSLANATDGAEELKANSTDIVDDVAVHEAVPVVMNGAELSVTVTLEQNATLEAIQKSNLTLTDGLAVLELQGASPPPHDSETISEKSATRTPEEEALAEMLETEAILNAPPAADSIEILEMKDGPVSSLANATLVVDELAILEMDEPLMSNSTVVDLVFDSSAISVPSVSDDKSDDPSLTPGDKSSDESLTDSNSERQKLEDAYADEDESINE